MREVLQQIFNGNYTTQENGLEVSSSKIEFSIPSDCDYEGSFHIYANHRAGAEGHVTSTDLRMELLNDRITGSDTEISFHFHGEMCREGEVVKGAFCIISNQGESFVPYVASIEHPLLESSNGQIQNLFQFANLAKTNLVEATRIFYSPEFEHMLESNDPEHLETYRALSGQKGNRQNLDEFLISAGKKQPVEYALRTGDFVIRLSGTEGGSPIHEKEIEIVRNGWGYTRLQLECKGEFLFTERTVLTDDNFLGTTCRLPIFIDTTQCGQGRHFGKVILSTPYQMLEIPVEVSMGLVQNSKFAVRNRKQMYSQLTGLYIRHRFKETTTAQYLASTGRIVEQLISMDEDSILPRLLKAQMLITEDRSNEAGWVLDSAADLLEKQMKTLPRREADMFYCYHSYLTTLIRKNESYVREVTEEVERIFRRNREDWRIAWLLLYLPSSYNASPTERWRLLQEQFEYGCTSPVLYTEALQLFNQNPTLARKLDPYIQQVFLFGAKRLTLRQETVEQILYLAGKTREYYPLLLRALELIYEKAPDRRVLQEICSQLIKGGRKDSRSSKWYRKGVEEELRLTNLYEYYVCSLDLKSKEDIPRIVLMYFTYTNHLDYEHMAYIYYYLIKNKREYAEIYENNYVAMERFAIAQIQNMRINRHLAMIYDDVLNPATLNRALAQNLADLLFANWLETGRRDCIAAYVYQKGCREPRKYDLEGGTGWVSIYGNDYTVVVEDKDGNRYLNSAEITLEKLMLSGRYLRAVSDFVWDNERLNLYLCTKDHDFAEVTEDNVQRFVQLSESEDIEDKVARSMAIRAMEYYEKKDEKQALERCLSHVKLEDMSEEEKRLIFPYLVSGGQKDRALDFLRANGPYFAEAVHLQRLLDEVLEEEPEADPFLTACAAWVFAKGREDGILLRYLALNYEGLCRDLRKIWKEAGSLGLDRQALEERLLLQMLYTGAFVGERSEILRDYVANGGDREVINAFLLQSAYDFFVSEKVLSDVEAKELTRYAGQNPDVPDVAALACLKYYSENPDSVDDQAREHILRFLERLMDKKIHLGFFLKFREPSMFPAGEQKDRLENILDEMKDRTIVDYRCRPGNLVKIHYMMVGEKDEEKGYTEEYMRDVCGGVCFKEFVLFFGESLQYYITEEQEGSSELTASGDLQKSDIAGAGSGTRYDMINDMLISNTLQDYDTFDHLLYDYHRKEYLNRELFRVQ